jgi:DNA-binding NtrC family response regulator
MENKIIYAEDERTSSEDLLEFFKEEFPSCEIVFVEDGSSLEKILRQGGLTNKDMVITDDGMPGKLGSEIIKDNYDIIKNIPTLMYYAGDKDIGEEAMKHGAKGYFLKPHFDSLIEEMKKYLE